MRGWPFALLGFFSVAFAAMIAIAAPTDGQTGMCCCPGGFLGTFMLAYAIDRARASRAARWEWVLVLTCAALSVVLVVAAYIVGENAVAAPR